MPTEPALTPQFALGIDLGGTNARAAVVDSKGLIVSSAKGLLDDRSPAAVVEAIALASESALAAAGGVVVLACGVGAAGQLRGDSGVVAVAPNLGWREVPLGALLSKRLGRRVRVVNDLSAAAWGEKSAGAARGERDVYTVFVGSGVGSAIIANGQLVTGATGVAGELGHTKWIPGGRLCGCGERGCLEAYAGGHNLIVQMREAIDAGESTHLAALVGGDLTRLTAEVLEQAAQEGDAAALAIYERAVGLLGQAIANQVTMLNPSHLILGGGVLRHSSRIYGRIVEGVHTLASMVSRQALRISPAALGDDSGLIGAALLAMG
ncbi:MAG: ROK family protein [Myxococcaceae bacterium]